jgi:hypothetical protein
MARRNGPGLWRIGYQCEQRLRGGRGFWHGVVVLHSMLLHKLAGKQTQTRPNHVCSRPSLPPWVPKTRVAVGESALRGGVVFCHQ